MSDSLGFIALMTTYLRIYELQVHHYFETWKNGALVLGFLRVGVSCVALNPKYMTFHRAELELSFHLSVEGSPLASLHGRNSIRTTHRTDFPNRRYLKSCRNI